jgi:hypothetical protein
MKTLLVSFLALLAWFGASAQVSLEVVMDQDQFLPSESMRLAVKITNRSGQELHLGATPDWLTFSVESEDNFVVVKNADVPVVEPFDLESSQMATKHVDLEPYFQMGRPARYKVTATLRIKEWGQTVSSAPAHFDVVNGGELWSQDFGVMMVSNTPPEARRYTLLKANYLREQLRLYVEVTTGDGSQVFKVTPLGPMVSFSVPEEQVDPANRLHVLWQTGAQSFSYVVVSANGTVASRDTYDNFNSRPHLSVTGDGAVAVVGGVRRPKAGDVPQVRLPQPQPIPVPPPPAK